MKVKRALIPAAGLGTRFLPITKAIPKPMLSVLDKPTIQYIVEELKGAGIEEIIIVVGADCDVIKNHFAVNTALEERLISDNKQKLLEIAKETSSFNVKFAVQKVANGLAGAILSAEEYLLDEPFALLLGDELIYTDSTQKPCIQYLIDSYEKTGKSIIATMQVFGDDVSKYGNLGIEDEIDGVMKINAIIEKPSINEALSNFAIIGRYVLSGEVIGKLKKLKPHGNEIFLTDVLDELAKKGELYATEFEGVRYDVGDKFGYVKANLEYALRNKELGEETKRLVLKIAKSIEND